MEKISRNVLVEEISANFYDSAMPMVLLVAIGFPRSRIPSSTTPYVFWHRVLDELEGGILDGGSTLLARELVRLYPGNGIFERYLDDLVPRSRHELDRRSSDVSDATRAPMRGDHGEYATWSFAPDVLPRRPCRCVFWNCSALKAIPCEMTTRDRLDFDGPSAWLSTSPLCPAHHQELQLVMSSGQDPNGLVERAALDSRLHFESGAFQHSLRAIQLSAFANFALRDYDRAADALLSSLIQCRALGLTQEVSQVVDDHSWLVFGETGHLWISFPRLGRRFRSVRPFRASPVTRLRYLKEALAYHMEIEPSVSKSHTWLMVSNRMPQADAEPFYGNIRASILSRSALILPRPRKEILGHIEDAAPNTGQYAANLALYDFWRNLRTGKCISMAAEQVQEIERLKLNQWTQLDLDYAGGMSLVVSGRRQLRIAGLARILATFGKAKFLGVRHVPTASPAFGVGFNPISFAMKLMSPGEIQEANESMAAGFYCEDGVG